MPTPTSRYFHARLGPVDIRQGFCWPAFFFGSLWAISTRMGLPAVPLMLALDGVLWFVILDAAVEGNAGLAVIGLAVWLAYAVVRGRHGIRWREASLERRGYVLLEAEHAATAWGQTVSAQRERYRQLPTDALLREIGQVGHSARVDLLEELRARGVAVPTEAEVFAAARAAKRQADETPPVMLAAPFTRLLAVVVDFFFLLPVQFTVEFVATAVSGLPSNQVTAALHLPVFIGYWLLRDAVGGRSVGKRLFGMAVRDRSTGAPCDLRQAVLRNVPLCIPLDWLFVLGDERARLGDRLAGTKVVQPG